MAGRDKPEIISVSEAASSLGVSSRQVRNLIQAGTLSAQMVGGSYMIRRADLAKVPVDRKPGPKPAAAPPPVKPTKPTTKRKRGGQ
jgi:excisionase family DNA binding protein